MLPHRRARAARLVLVGTRLSLPTLPTYTLRYRLYRTVACALLTTGTILSSARSLLMTKRDISTDSLPWRSTTSHRRLICGGPTRQAVALLLAPAATRARAARLATQFAHKAWPAYYTACGDVGTASGRNHLCRSLTWPVAFGLRNAYLLCVAFQLV